MKCEFLLVLLLVRRVLPCFPALCAPYNMNECRRVVNEWVTTSKGAQLLVLLVEIFQNKLTSFGKICNSMEIFPQERGSAVRIGIHACKRVSPRLLPC